jgi:hypothetical protein
MAQIPACGAAAKLREAGSDMKMAQPVSRVAQRFKAILL